MELQLKQNMGESKCKLTTHEDKYHTINFNGEHGLPVHGLFDDKNPIL